MDTGFRVTAFGFRQTIFITTPFPTIFTRPLGIRERKGEGIIARLPKRLKPEHDSSGWLRRVRPAVSVQGSKSKVRILVHKTSVFSTQREVLRQSVIGACSVQESAPALSAGAGNRSAIVA